MDTGAHVRVEDGDPYSSGWTALGQCSSVTQDGVLTLCSPGADPCHTQPLPDGRVGSTVLVRLGGVVYES